MRHARNEIPSIWLSHAPYTAFLTDYGWADLLPKRTCELLLNYEDPPSSEDSGAASDGAGGRRKKKPWRDDVPDEVLARLLKLDEEWAAEEQLTGSAASAARSLVTKPKQKRGKKPSAAPSQGEIIPPPRGICLVELGRPLPILFRL